MSHMINKTKTCEMNDLEYYTMLLNAEEVMEVEHHDTLRKAVGYGLTDADVVYLLDWKADAA